MYRRLRGRRFHDDAAVTDVLGSILLVSITVLVSGTLSLLVVKSMNPVGRLYADVDVGLDPGTGAWGGGDENVWVLHRGGSPLARDLTRFVVSVAGQETAFEGNALVGAAFADGALSTGERWSYATTLVSCNPVEVDIVVFHNGGSSQLLTRQSLVANAAQCLGG